jgi:rhodanese-related sulfurtransferase
MELVVLFDSTGFGGGEVSRSVKIHSNDLTGERKTLTITGYVREAAPHEGSASTLYYGFYLLIDLRSPEEYARGHLLGAINIPFSELSQWLDRLPKQFAIYLYDETGVQATLAAQMLQDQGFVVARAISGGLAGWWNEVGDAFFVWPEGAERTPPSGMPHYGGYSVKPQYVVRSYQVLIDLRPPEAFTSGHLPGAINIAPHGVSAWAAGLPSPEEIGRLYVWCVDENGLSACQAAQWLRENGLPDARCMIGGLEQWRIRYGDELLWPEANEG